MTRSLFDLPEPPSDDTLEAAVLDYLRGVGKGGCFTLQALTRSAGHGAASALDDLRRRCVVGLEQTSTLPEWRLTWIARRK